MSTKKQWLREAAELFEISGSSIPMIRAKALFKRASHGYLPTYWLRKKRNRPFVVVGKEVSDHPYTG